MQIQGITSMQTLPQNDGYIQVDYNDQTPHIHFDVGYKDDLDFKPSASAIAYSFFNNPNFKRYLKQNHFENIRHYSFLDVEMDFGESYERTFTFDDNPIVLLISVVVSQHTNDDDSEQTTTMSWQTEYKLSVNPSYNHVVPKHVDPNDF
jgi:hypothetical protein